MFLKLIEFPKNETCDVVILTNTADNETYEMTQQCISSLRESEENNKFRVILVESNKSSAPLYDTDVYIHFNDDFNYNKFLNLGFEHCTSDYVCAVNNDTFALKNWYGNIRYHMDVFNLDSASPWCPQAQTGPNPVAQQMLLNYPPNSVILGYEAMIHIAGWCWIMKKSVLDELLPFPEKLDFWFADNFLGHQLREKGYKHGCVTSSHYIHYGQKSYRHIDPKNIHGMTIGAQQKYLELIR